MFFADPLPVFAGLRAAVALGARLVFSCFRSPAANPWATTLVAAVTGAGPPPSREDYAPGPFGFADPDWVGAMLREAGWAAGPPEPVDFAYVAGAGDDPVADATAFFRRIGPVAAALRALPDTDRPAALDRLQAAIREHREADQVSFPAAAWIWSARA